MHQVKRLELVGQTEVDLNPGRVVTYILFVGIAINAVLDVAGTDVERGALGEVVLVTSSSHEASEIVFTCLEVFSIVGGGIQITQRGLDLAVADRNINACHHRPTSSVPVSCAYSLSSVILIVAQTAPTSGAVYIDGKKIEGTGTERGVVFQQYALFPWLTVLKNVMFGLKLQGKSDAEAKEIAMKYIKMVQLEDFVNHYPKELSGGMKQRVAIARAYAVKPEVLLMDEPFGALDAQTRTQLQTELLKTWESERKTCFFITHDVDEAIILAQRVIVMSARPGRIKDIVDIDIPYPRDQETKMSPRFMELKNHIWSQVYQEYLEVRK